MPTATPGNKLAAHNLNTEDGFREFVTEAQRQLRVLHDIFTAAGDMLRDKLSRTPTHGEPAADSRKEARAIHRRFVVAATSMQFATRALLWAIRRFDDKWVKKEHVRPGMKMNEGRTAA